MQPCVTLHSPACTPFQVLDQLQAMLQERVWVTRSCIVGTHFQELPVDLVDFLPFQGASGL